jgi:hypothetical protein
MASDIRDRKYLRSSHVLPIALRLVQVFRNQFTPADRLPGRLRSRLMVIAIAIIVSGPH